MSVPGNVTISHHLHNFAILPHDIVGARLYWPALCIDRGATISTKHIFKPGDSAIGGSTVSDVNNNAVNLARARWPGEEFRRYKARQAGISCSLWPRRRRRRR